MGSGSSTSASIRTSIGGWRSRAAPPRTRTIRDRFFQEARIAGNLHHRNIVTVYDFGVEGGVPYLVQEYLSGEDLDRKMRRRDFVPFPEKLLYLVQIARGLEYAHTQGVIHRDVKPANIRILEDGTAKIMDFGIAKLANQESRPDADRHDPRHRRPISPRSRSAARRVDRRTDIFSYGVLAYELLAYERPFAGQHISTVLYQILNEEPRPLEELLPDLPMEPRAAWFGAVSRRASSDATGASARCSPT